MTTPKPEEDQGSHLHPVPREGEPPAKPGSGGIDWAQVGRSALKVVVAVLLGCLLFVWWMAIVSWYIVWFLIFGLLFPLFRLFRRSSRKSKVDAQRHRELLQATQGQGVDANNLRSEKMVVSSPMSFDGAYKRIRNLYRSIFPEG